MAHIDLHLDNPHQASASYPFSSIDTSLNTGADADSDVQCGQGLTLKIFKLKDRKFQQLCVQIWFYCLCKIRPHNQNLD